MLVMKITGCVVLGILTAFAFGYVFLYLLSKSLDWLDAHYGTRIRRLLKQPLQSGGNDSGRKRGDAEYRIYSHYLLQSARRLLKWVNDTAYVHVYPQHKNTGNQCPNASPKGFVQLRHIVSILNRLRQRVNQSGKEPCGRCGLNSISQEGQLAHFDELLLFDSIIFLGHRTKNY